MFHNAKVGDKVWSVLRGWGTILDINCGAYPILVRFPEESVLDGVGSYTFDGKFRPKDIIPEIYWDELDLPEAPEKPAERLTGWYNVCFNECEDPDSEYYRTPYLVGRMGGQPFATYADAIRAQEGYISQCCDSVYVDFKL